jgi:hypothetical protein
MIVSKRPNKTMQVARWSCQRDRLAVFSALAPFESLTLSLLHQRLKPVNSLKTAVNAVKADIRNPVDVFDVSHFQFAKAAGNDFQQA